MQERNSNYRTMLPLLRVATQCSIDENLNHPENYAREGKWMRRGVAILLGESNEILPDIIPVAPNLSLQTNTVELRRQGQAPDMHQSSLHDVWFKYSGLIINAIERRLG